MLAIIGGTGFHKLEDMKILDEIIISTPFGEPSSPIIYAEYEGTKFLLLIRHGKNHELLPHEINYRANIWALKQVKATRIIGVSACGSLREEIQPGELVMPNQYFDWTQGYRDHSFFGDGLVAHISTEAPTCPVLEKLIVNTASKLYYQIHTNKTYGCTNGPRLGTIVENSFLRDSANCDIAGMTNIPEVFLAREAQLCYNTICIVTDYDKWHNEGDDNVTELAVIERYKYSMSHVQTLLQKVLQQELPPFSCECRESLNGAILTPEENLTESKKALLDLLKS